MQVAIPLFPGFTALDWVGPYQVLSNVPGVDVVLCSAEPGLIRDDNDILAMAVTLGLDDVPRPDVVVVPGGPSWAVEAARETALVEWLRRVDPTTTWTTSVCTGALILGAAGLLAGRRATTHWAEVAELAAHGATAIDERVVVDGKIVTAAGVSAGIDFALTLVARQWGDDVARSVQLGIEYDPQPPFDAGSPAKVPTELRDLVASLLAAAAPA